MTFEGSAPMPDLRGSALETEWRNPSSSEWIPSMILRSANVGSCSGLMIFMSAEKRDPAPT